MYHSRLVGSDRAGGIGLGFSRTVLYTQERTLHAVLFACDAIKGLGEGVAGGVVLVASAAAGNGVPTAGGVLLYVVAAYAKLGGGALARAIHSETEIATAKRRKGNAITTEIVASSGSGVFISDCCGEQKEKA